MTSLSRQLENLQIPDALLAYNLQNKRASILFEAQEAADIDIDTIFSIGNTGLEELQNIDPEFLKFEKTLFSETAKSIERTQQPKEFNDRLDKKLSEFLVCVSPYILTKPAQQALEWLVRRFRIHVFNTDSLMSCILPFHETNLFSRVVSIITFNKETEKWQWLASCQKAGTPLSKLTLIQHCLSDSAFLTFVCEMIPKAIGLRQGKSMEKLKTLFSFYASVLLGVAESAPNLNESRVGKILPYLYQGLKSDIEDYKVSSYMVLSQVCLMKTFKEQTIVPFVDLICKSLSADTMKLGIITLECIYRRHKGQLPNKALRRLCETKGAISLISELAEQNSLPCLLSILLVGIVNLALISSQSDESATEKSSDFISVFTTLFQVSKLEGNSLKYILRRFFEQYIKLRKVSSDPGNLLKLGKKLMQSFEKRYPAETDSVVKDFISQNSETELLQELFLAGGASSKYKVIPGTETLLIVNLNHPEPVRRKMAVQEDESVEGREFMQSALVQRLNDDDDSVFMEILKAGSCLLKVVEEATLLDLFLRKLKAAPFQERLPLAANIVEIFREHKFSVDSDQVSTQLIYCLIPSLLPSISFAKEQLSIYKNLLESDFGLKNPFVLGIRTVLQKTDLKDFQNSSENKNLIATMYLSILDAVSSLLTEDNDREFWIKSALEAADTGKTNFVFEAFLYAVLFTLLDQLPQAQVYDFISKFEDFIRKTVSSFTTVEGKEGYTKALRAPNDVKATFSEIINAVAIKSTAKDKARFTRMNVFCLFLRKILHRLSSQDTITDEVSQSSEFHVKIFEMLASASGKEKKRRPYVLVFRSLLQEFLKLHFPSPKALLKFLCQIFMIPKSLSWLVDRNCVLDRVEVIVCALHIFKVCMETLEQDIESMFSFDSQVLPTLLSLLHHPLKVVREAAIGCIQALNDNDRIKLDDGLKYLLKFTVGNDTEIVEDSQQICHVVEKLFKPLSSSSTDVEMLEPKELEDMRLLTKYFSSFIWHSNVHLQLGIATITSSVIFQEFLLHLTPVVGELIKVAQTKGLTEYELQLLRILLRKFTPAVVDVFEKFPASLRVFKTALTLGSACPGTILTIQEECLKQVTVPLFEAITSSKIQNEIFETLLTSFVNSSSTSVSKVIQAKLVELPISAEDIADQITGFKEHLQGPQPSKSKKARRTTKSFTNEDDSSLTDSPHWNKVVILLEVIQLKSNLEFNEKLVVSIFEMLSLCLEVNTTSQPSIEYMKQLLLGAICRGVEQIIESGSRDILHQDKFSVAKIIECFRTSENPQTHHQALLVLGKAASLFPDLVLHNVMSIFTFMGANVLRQDDSYSFEIIKRTIDSVIPTLVSTDEDVSSSSKDVYKPKVNDIVKLVVRVFVDAVPYIPEHRRIILLHHLTHVLGSERHLYVVVAILLEKMFLKAEKQSDSEQTTEEMSLSPEFCFLLVKNFSLQEQAVTIANLIEFLSSLPDDQQQESQSRRVTRGVQQKTEELVPLFDTKKHTTQEIRQYKNHCLELVSQMLSSRDFDITVTRHLTLPILKELYLRLVEEILQFVCAISIKAENDTKSSSTKYWKAMMLKGSELVQKVYRLLEFDIFAHVTSLLMQNENPAIRKKAIELTAEHLKEAKELSRHQKMALIDIATSLVNLANTDSPELPAIKHAALQVLRLIVQLLGKEFAEELRCAVPVTIAVILASDGNPQITASAFACIGELSSCLSFEFIEFLPKLMPPLLQLLTKGKDSLLLNAFTALQKILESLSKFMSPYLGEILSLITKAGPDDNEQVSKSSTKKQIRSKIALISQTVSTSVTPRVLLPALDACFDQVAQSDEHSLSLLMDIAQDAIESMPRDRIKTHHLKLLAFFLKALDVRRLLSRKPEKQINIEEEKIITAFCSLVMRLSENIFRPMFLKIFSWATADEENLTRLITFYRLSGAIAGKLKGLFLLFAGHITKPCAELVAKCNTNSEGFVNKERFEYLMMPLVDQIDNEIGEEPVYNDRVINHLIPCLASFAVAVNEESCWKTLNYQVLLKTRHQSTQVRFATLKLLEEIHKQIGESYLILLPETIPFLAELMEDESFEVEKQCQHVISHMEEILGESLQKYF
eukprot:gene4548-20800_t